MEIDGQALHAMARYQEGVAWDSARTELDFHGFQCGNGAPTTEGAAARRLQDVDQTKPGQKNLGDEVLDILNPNHFCLILGAWKYTGTTANYGILD